MTRIAMIGGGPKCLFALLELNDCLDGQDARTVQVDVYDPYPPGAGRVWNTGQPRELRLNVNSRIIDASSSLCAQNFDQWQTSSGEEVDPRDSYPARARVGEYLSEQFERLKHEGTLNVVHRAVIANSVLRRGPQWEVLTDCGRELYDEVVIATGHGLAGYRSPRSLRSSLSAAQLTVEYDTKSVEKVPSGSNVLIRGAALTAYDVVLALTEGRSGDWERVEHNRHPALHYIPSGQEPARITMTSRTSIPMIPKPQSVPHKLGEVLEIFRTQIMQWGEVSRAERANADLDGLWQILLECALQCARRCGIQSSARELWNTVQTGESVAMASLMSPAEKLRASLRAQYGVDPVSDEWIWGIVWSGLYGQLVRVLSRIQWRAEDRTQFNSRAKNLERMAFGPPESTALKLLGLFDAGIIHQESCAEHTSSRDITIDAVTAPAGVLDGPAPQGLPAHPLFSSLLAAEEIMIRPGERGLLTDTDGTCLNARGERNESLSALGRPTEDPTLGHDTLNRALHPEYRAWAQRIALKMTATSQKVVH